MSRFWSLGLKLSFHKFSQMPIITTHKMDSGLENVCSHSHRLVSVHMQEFNNRDFL